MDAALAGIMVVLVVCLAFFCAALVILRLLQLSYFRLNQLVESLEIQKEPPFKNIRRNDSLTELLKDHEHPQPGSPTGAMPSYGYAAFAENSPRIVEWVESVESVTRGRAHIEFSSRGSRTGSSFGNVMHEERKRSRKAGRSYADFSHAAPRSPRQATLSPPALAQGTEVCIRGQC